MRRRWFHNVIGCALAASCVGSAAAADVPPAKRAFERGVELRQQGQISRSVDELRRACTLAPDEASRMLIHGELGASLLQARRLDEAAETLQRAHAGLQGRQRARVALDLGNLALLRGRPEQARDHYRQARQLADGDPGIDMPARLNLARASDGAGAMALLEQLERDLAGQPASAQKWRWQINLGRQFAESGEAGIAPAWRILADVVRSAAAAGESLLLAESLDALGQLYEGQGRLDDAMQASRRGLAAAAGLSAGSVGDLNVRLEWRQARIDRQQGRSANALAAYQRAVQHVERLRQDLPIDDESGRSTYRTMLQPIYLGLVDQLLRSAGDAAPAPRAAALRQVIETVELLRQSELQDYLGDRCEVDAVKGGTATVLPPGHAVLYPVVLDDRVELLLETSTGLSRHRSPLAPRVLREMALRFAATLRFGQADYLDQARRLYDGVLRPVESALQQQQVTTLVMVPDGALRLVAVGAFHDGQRYAIEKYAIATATGLSMTNTARDTPIDGVLLAGLAEPGPVVDKLDRRAIAQLLGPQAANRFSGAAAVENRGLRSMRGAGVPLSDAAPGDADSRQLALREALSLPGVRREVAAIDQVAGGERLLDEAFTLDNFRRQAESGRFSVIHLASHGVFGGSREATYLLTYDQLLTLDDLQSLLTSDAFRRRPIELLSLSACETAEGDDRSPLGISGAAIKARARAVMGSLWPVSDDAAVDLMAGFYRRLLEQRAGKAQALQQSQIALLRNPDYAHPFFWAPFILIGNWF
ncbi:CHAT domain-containing protein [Piscinibacter sakaiensis]|uniref:CHAT domain-containing protein n=1 Tax=Piscinibacter sakaiensis TaxID=1547922 RepID=UPI003AAFF8D9